VERDCGTRDSTPMNRALDVMTQRSPVSKRNTLPSQASRVLLLNMQRSTAVLDVKRARGLKSAPPRFDDDTPGVKVG
jgi:hypothetical protein